MHYLIFVNEFLPIKNPISKFLDKMINNSSFKNDSFLIVCKGDSNNIIDYKNNSKILSLNYFSKRNKLSHSIIKFIYRIMLKIYGWFYPKSIFDFLWVKKKALKELEKYDFDAVISISGWFWCARMASYIASNNSIPFYSFYMDPFLNNVNNKHYHITKLKKIENEWLNSSKMTFVFDTQFNNFLNLHPFYEQKVLSVKLPFGYNDNELRVIRDTKIINKRIVHAGQFYEPIRSPKPLIEIAKHNSDYSFVSLGPLQPKEQKKYTSEMPPNLSFLEYKIGEEYLKEIGQSEFLLIVDNANGKEIPSKCYEYISTNKTIILLYYSDESDIFKYLKPYNNCLFINISKGDYKIKIGTQTKTNNISSISIPSEDTVFSQIKNYICNS